MRAALADLRHDTGALIGSAFLVVLVLAAVLAPWIAQSPTELDISARLVPPFWAAEGGIAHPLGTDGLGRDMLARLIYGARVTLLIAVSVVLLSAALGTLLGLVAGYKHGWWDVVIMRFTDASLAFPGLLLVIVVLAYLGTGIVPLIFVMVLFSWMVYTRMVRGMVLQLRETPAVQAAEMVGCSTPRILRRYLLPSLYPALLTQGMIELARVALAEASLSFLGYGIQPPNASWGLMVTENQEFIADAWWTVALPGLALAATVLAINLVSNWARVQSDPEQARRRFGRVAARRRRRRPAEIVAAAAPPPDALLAVEGLDVRFDTPDGEVRAVTDVSLTVRAGETLAIVGESGSGKSSTGLALLDLVPPPGRTVRGSFAWEGRPIGRREIHALRGSAVTLIFQDPLASLNPLVKVGRQVAEVLVKHKGLSKEEARARAEELFALVGIPSPAERLDQYPHELSGGLRQRVMIAIALAPEPKLIIADEPTTALDATIQAQILELIRDLQQKLGIAMILITHDLGVVAHVSDRVVVMYAGRVVEEGPSERLLTAPRHPYTQALLAAVPQVHERRASLVSIPGHPPSRVTAAAGCPFEPRCARAVPRCADMPELVAEAPGRRLACWRPVEAAEPARVEAAP